MNICNTRYSLMSDDTCHRHCYDSLKERKTKWYFLSNNYRFYQHLVVFIEKKYIKNNILLLLMAIVWLFILFIILYLFKLTMRGTFRNSNMRALFELTLTLLTVSLFAIVVAVWLSFVFENREYYLYLHTKKIYIPF